MTEWHPSKQDENENAFHFWRNEFHYFLRHMPLDAIEAVEEFNKAIEKKFGNPLPQSHRQSA